MNRRKWRHDTRGKPILSKFGDADENGERFGSRDTCTDVYSQMEYNDNWVYIVNRPTTLPEITRSENFRK